jgi:hypothetical protein
MATAAHEVDGARQRPAPMMARSDGLDIGDRIEKVNSGRSSSSGLSVALGRHRAVETDAETAAARQHGWTSVVGTRQPFYVSTHGDRMVLPTMTNSRVTHDARDADRRAPLFSCFPNKNKPKFRILPMKNRYKMGKTLEKFMDVGNLIYNTFHYYNFFQISTDFEIFKTFQVKTGLTDLCSIGLIATIFSNRPELLFGQGVLHGALQTLHYNQLGMHQISLKTQEDVEFPRWLSVKQNLRKISCLESVLYSSA